MVTFFSFLDCDCLHPGTGSSLVYIELARVTRQECLSLPVKDKVARAGQGSVGDGEGGDPEGAAG